MDKEKLATIFEEGGNLITMLLRNRDLFARPAPAEAPLLDEIEESPGALSEKASSIPAGCVPCSIGHLGTCTGLLNEAMRFAHKDGVESGEVIDRVNMCMDELNALERVDLRPEMIHGLPEWEKTLAEQALTLSRDIRHGLEGLSNVTGLEAVAAKTQEQRKAIGKAWFTKRLSLMSPEQRQEVEEKLKARVAEREEQAQTEG